MTSRVTLVHEPRNEDLPRFSATQTAKFLHCPAAWFHSRTRPWEGSAAASLGTEVHARLEEWQKGADDVPDDVPATTKRDALGFLGPDELRRADVMARAIRTEFPGPAENVIPERRFMVTLYVGDRAMCQLSGLIDTEWRHGPQEIEVMDLKTTGNFSRALTVADMPGDPQVALYVGVGFAESEELERVRATWVYAHSRNKKKILGPKPSRLFTRSESDLALTALWLSAWEPMIRASGRKRAPKGNAPAACTKYRWGCDYNGDPCKDFARLGPAVHLSRADHLLRVIDA